VLGLYAIAIWVVELSTLQEVVVSEQQIVSALEKLRGRSEPASTEAEAARPTGPSMASAPAKPSPAPRTPASAPPSALPSQSGFAPDCADGAGRVFPVLEDPIPTDAEALSSIAKGLREAAWAALRLLRETRPNQRLVAIALVGSADRRPLSPERARYFGSNEGLAQARATIVAAALRNHPPEQVPPILLILNAGSTVPGFTLPRDPKADNRAVLICAYWEPEAE
jgi:hypothetical protein